MNGLPRTLRWLVLAILLAFPGQPAGAKTAKALDLTDTVATNRILTKLSTMVQGSDLATFLSSKGPFTFFAPTDAAFAKFAPDTLDELLQPQNKERLQRILLFHVVNGKKLFAKDLTPLSSLVSCEGNPLAIKTNKLGTQLVLNAKIVHADIRCANGVIHEIDTVLMPPEAALPPLLPFPPPTLPPTPVTNAPPNPSPDTNAPPTTPPHAAAATDTNGAPIVPVAPTAPFATNASPATNAPRNPSPDTNAPPTTPPHAAATANTNGVPVTPIAPTPVPETSSH